MWLIYGSKGWIGRQFCELLDVPFHEGEARCDNYNDVREEVKKINPSHVIIMIGRTCGPGFTGTGRTCGPGFTESGSNTDNSTIDYLELPGNEYINLRDNLIAPITIASVCAEFNIHLTYLGTGCIFTYNHIPRVFSVNEEPNFQGSAYSRVKSITDKFMRERDNVLNVRIRMPITYRDEGKNFISKIIRYKKISSCDNSMTVLPDLLPCLIDMIKNSKVGTVHLVNPGCINHELILKMYQGILNRKLDYTLVNDDNLGLRAPRSRCLLEHNLNRFTDIAVPDIFVSVINVLKKWED